MVGVEKNKNKAKKWRNKICARPKITTTKKNISTRAKKTFKNHVVDRRKVMQDKNSSPTTSPF